MSTRPQSSKRWREHLRHQVGRAPRGLRKEDNPNAPANLIEANLPDWQTPPTDHCPHPEKRKFNSAKAAVDSCVYNCGGSNNSPNGRVVYLCPGSKCGCWHLATARPNQHNGQIIDQYRPDQEVHR